MLSWRNTLAHWLCNFILNHLATREYRDAVDYCVSRGIESLEEELAVQRKSP
jgi:hypothetical protein